jgi:prefoldin subunit 5
MTWNTDRLDDRFKAIDSHLHDMRETIRASAPLMRQVAVLEAKVDDIEKDITEMKADVVKLADGTTEIIRSNRADTVKIIAAFASPAIVAVLGLVGALLTGRI